MYGNHGLLKVLDMYVLFLENHIFDHFPPFQFPLYSFKITILESDNKHQFKKKPLQQSKG